VSSSCTAAEVHRLQDGILEQLKQIEQFINATDGTESSSSLPVLKTLFSLFKSELTVNLSLRQLLVEQKQTSESPNSAIDDFLQRVRELGYGNANDLMFVLAVLQSQSKRIRRLKKAGKSAAEQIRQNEETSERLQIQEAESSVLNVQLSKASTEAACLQQ
jgi:hypothetical protein